MQINLTGHHVEITEALRDYVNNKFAKLERHFDHINNVHVVLSVEKLNQIAEAKLHVSGVRCSPIRSMQTCTLRLIPCWTSWIGRSSSTKIS